MKRLRTALCLLCLMPLSSVFAWNALGHRLIAQIAYDHLTPRAKQVFNHYNQVLNHKHKRLSFVNAAVWLDRLYAHDLRSLKPIHYIDIPFSTDGSSLRPIKRVNAVWAITMAEKQLLNPNASDFDKGLSLRILLHVVGDIHQPLHAATRFSRRYPTGDKGGNLVVLQKNAVAKNLHSYWDNGAGLFIGHAPYRAAQVKAMARAIERQEPCRLTGMDRDPMPWARESHVLAITIAYGLLDQSRVPSAHYQQTAERIVEQRTALAGCRLATLLNAIAKEQAASQRPIQNF